MPCAQACERGCGSSSSQSGAAQIAGQTLHLQQGRKLQEKLRQTLPLKLLLLLSQHVRTVSKVDLD